MINSVLEQVGAKALVGAIVLMGGADAGRAADPASQIGSGALYPTPLSAAAPPPASTVTAGKPEHGAGNEFEARALRSAMHSGAVLIRQIREDHRRLEALERASAVAEGLRAVGAEHEQRADQVLEVVQAQRERSAISVRAYFDLLIETSETYEASAHQDQLAALARGFERSNTGSFIEFAELFVAQLVDYQAERVLDEELYLQQIMDL